jgi:Icc-related predicted phosphoesterase
MRFCSIADIHGKLNLSIDKCDILCICGDIVPLNIQRNDDLSYAWLETKFLNWVNKQPCDKVLLIGGNHDFAIYHNPDRIREIFKGTKVEYLFDNEFVYQYEEGKQVKFYGSPWCHKFYNWAYMDYDDDQLKETFLKMPDDVDVLMTHDCPYGVCDVILQDVWWADGKHIGSKGLAEAVIEKKPRVMITGHLHSTNKVGEVLGDTMVYNTSVVDETYEMAYQPHYFEVNDDGEIVFLNKEQFV